MRNGGDLKKCRRSRQGIFRRIGRIYGRRRYFKGKKLNDHGVGQLFRYRAIIDAFNWDHANYLGIYDGGSKT